MQFLFSILSGGAPEGGDWTSYILIGVLLVGFVVMMIFSSRSNKKKQEEQQAIMNAVRPGNKVKTIGGVCGIVVEVNEEENTFVLETGNELNGKSYIKFDKQAIYQTDAKAEVKTEAKAEKPETADSAQNSQEKSEQ
ncbi:MAG: preprotein translocase subunit YajC [Clostridia bacterium]|nr:preprotein translocase subunit YajC [Clostridia bacterium]